MSSNGATFSKGYFILPLHYKVRKVHIGNRWKTQFVTMHREEVKRLEEYQKELQVQKSSSPVSEFLEGISKETILV